MDRQPEADLAHAAVRGETMTIPERPDPQWCAALKVGDKVTIANRRRVVVGSAVVQAITPGGRLRVGVSQSGALYNRDGWCREVDYFGNRRYLVPPESAE